jgi:uncharacterized protein
MQGVPPKCVIEVKVDTVFFQCARAPQRARLWQPIDTHSLAAVPTAGRMLDALTDSAINGSAYDSALPARQRETLY